MISKKTINAIELCVLLAGQRHAYLTTTELSPRMGLSVSYLENLLKPLKDHHIVTSMKGPGGGYKIQGDVSLISIWDVAAVFEQTLGDDDQEKAVPHAYERELEQVVQRTLSGFVLSDFADFSDAAIKSFSQEVGRFKFKPLAAPFVPKAPNSVFQLHMSF